MMTDLTISSIKPLNGYVLIEPTEQPEQTASGLVLPKSDSEKPQDGTVLAVGGSIFDDGVEIKPPVKANDRVIYKKWGGTDVKIGEKEYQLMKFEDVIAVVAK